MLSYSLFQAGMGFLGYRSSEDSCKWLNVSFAQSEALP